jgi:hypothetical protein
MANCNTRYNNDKPTSTVESFSGADIGKGIGWTILAILCIAGLIGLFFGLSKVFT